MEIRVLHVIGGLKAGGMESLLLSYLRKMNRDRVIFDFLVQSENGLYESEVLQYGCKIFRVIPRRNNFLKHRKEMINFFETYANDYHIIHIHQGLTYWLPLSLSHKFKINNIIVHCHGLDPIHLKRWKYLVDYYLRPKILKYATYFFACSDDAGKLLFGNNILYNSAYRLLYNAIDLKQFQYDIEIRSRIRQELKIESDFVIGYVARFDHLKNQEFLIDLFVQFCNIHDDSLLLLIGNGDRLLRMKQIVEDLQLQNKVMFIEQSQEVFVLLQVMDVFVFPSKSEGLGIVAIEAQASGLPVLASDCIPRETKVTNLIEYLSLLDKTPWLNSLDKLYKGYVRKCTLSELEMTKYNIEVSAKELESFYLSLEK